MQRPYTNAIHAAIVADVQHVDEKTIAMIANTLRPGGHLVFQTYPSDFSHATWCVNAGLEVRGTIRRIEPKSDVHIDVVEGFPEVQSGICSLNDPWRLARKPCEGTVAENLRLHKTGGLRRISDQQPFGDVIEDDRRCFLVRVVRALLPLGEGTVLDVGGDPDVQRAAQLHRYALMVVEV